MVAVSVYLRSRTRHRAKVARSSVAGVAGDVGWQEMCPMKMGQHMVKP